jgi:2,3,4,5-tetrahydropyridine-2-carboxylate N-succinyltransferase
MKHDLAALASTIETAFDARDTVSTSTRGEVRDAVETALNLLDLGEARVASRGDDGSWTVNQWLKKAVLLSFRLNPMEVIKGGPGEAVWWDKVPSKFEGWSANEFERAGFRAVPGSIVRRGSFIGKNVVLMPSFVNLGAYVDEGTMVDGWATVGSCAQIGKNVHLSGGVGIGGVLEPMQAGPDDHRGQLLHRRAFGSRRRLHRPRRLSARHGRVYIGKSTKIVNRMTGEVSATAKYRPTPSSSPARCRPRTTDAATRQPAPSLYCAVIVKTVDEKTRSKTGINELLRA